VLGLGGTSPRTRAQRTVWWMCFAVMVGFIAYVLIHKLVR
jgi:hypothetical protein